MEAVSEMIVSFLVHLNTSRARTTESSVRDPVVVDNQR